MDASQVNKIINLLMEMFPNEQVELQVTENLIVKTFLYDGNRYQVLADQSEVREMDEDGILMNIWNTRELLS